MDTWNWQSRIYDGRYVSKGFLCICMFRHQRVVSRPKIVWGRLSRVAMGPADFN